MSHRSRLCHIVIDVSDLDRAVVFWGRALDATEEKLNPASSRVYRRLRLPDSQVRLLLQATPDDKVSKARVHIDIETDEVEGEVRRLAALRPDARRARPRPAPQLRRARPSIPVGEPPDPAPGRRHTSTRRGCVPIPYRPGDVSRRRKGRRCRKSSAGRSSGRRRMRRSRTGSRLPRRRRRSPSSIDVRGANAIATTRRSWFRPVRELWR
ncbi:VOC family protein [Nocardia amikacinitolerans]|uniref:VOC family protein n=1 Tax=Nocardia amikacinitolerans TaxID=756689 RepID=UPI00369CA999